MKFTFSFIAIFGETTRTLTDMILSFLINPETSKETEGWKDVVFRVLEDGVAGEGEQHKIEERQLKLSVFVKINY